ncbi:MAG: SLBB domain-containing protein, partial [Deltaproteobacteria bacterium]|nr:SLBB domain-containing protein [Deltaproteobacteria bacterium]
LYDFLLKGDKSQDERLQSGDTIFVPVIGPVVGITGNVKRPAIYEMKGTMNLQEVIGLAGGVTFLGYLQRIQLERVESHQKKIVVDFDISESLYGERPQLDTPIQDGDLIKIYPILPTTQNIVYLEGHVKRPGGYEFKKGMKLLDLIPSFDELLPEPYLDHAEITRLIPPDFHPETISFNLGGLLKGDLSQNIELKEYDTVTVYSRDTLQEVPQVTIGGEVQRPGKYRLLENMRVKDLIYKAGNLKRSAYLPEAEITRLIKTEKTVLSKMININLGEALKENDKYNILLKEDDYVFVRRIPEWYTEKTCTIKGEVNFPGEYSISRGERLSSALERAGGFTEYAYLKGAFFTRESARRAQQERLKGFIDRLEADILRAQIKLAEGTLSEDAAKAAKQSLTAKRELVRKTKASQATGRVVIVLDSLDKFKGSKYDLELEDGDTLTIPPVPGTVNVMGSVYNPTSIVYTQGKRVDFYLNKVGGPTPDAEKGEMYIVKADGSIISKTQKGKFGILWDTEENRWVSGGFMSARIEPGDSILVPSKVTRFVWKREIKDWTTILYQLAITAGTFLNQDNLR